LCSILSAPTSDAVPRAGTSGTSGTTPEGGAILAFRFFEDSSQVVGSAKISILRVWGHVDEQITRVRPSTHEIEGGIKLKDFLPHRRQSADRTTAAPTGFSTAAMEMILYEGKIFLGDMAVVQ
jgi:hypothetical protein